MTDKQKLDAGKYTAENIHVLEGLEAVRKRPAMYIGDVGAKGLHHLVYEVVDNSIDEAMMGFCKNIYVDILPDNSVSVRDDGRGIPTELHKKEGRSALEVVMTVLHAGGKFDKDSYKVSGGLHGVGVSCVNALSMNLKAIVSRNGKTYEQEYSRGKPLYSVKETGTSDTNGTKIIFKPDDGIFRELVYNFDTIAARLRELAYLNRGIKLVLTDQREKDEKGAFITQSFYSEGGLVEFVKHIDELRTALILEPIYVEGERDNVIVEVAIQYNTGYSENVHSYVNNINTIEGGTHVAGFRRAITRVFKSYGEKNNLFAKLKIANNGRMISEKDYLPYYQLKFLEPQFEGTNKNQTWKF